MLLVNCFSLLCIQNVHLKCHGDIAVTGRRMKLELTMEQMSGNRENYWTEKLEDVRSVKKRVTTVSLRHLAQGCLIYATWWGKGEHLELIHTPFGFLPYSLNCSPSAPVSSDRSVSSSSSPDEMASAQSNHGYCHPFLYPTHRHTCSNFHVTTLQHSFKGINSVRAFFFFILKYDCKLLLLYKRTHYILSFRLLILDHIYSMAISWIHTKHRPILSLKFTSWPVLTLPDPWLTCDIDYEADCVFAHAGAGVQARILGRGVTDLQHLLLYQRAVVVAQRAAIFGPGDGPRPWQRAAEL